MDGTTTRGCNGGTLLPVKTLFFDVCSPLAMQWFEGLKPKLEQSDIRHYPSVLVQSNSWKAIWQSFKGCKMDEEKGPFPLRGPLCFGEDQMPRA